MGPRFEGDEPLEAQRLQWQSSLEAQGRLPLNYDERDEALFREISKAQQKKLNRIAKKKVNAVLLLYLLLLSLVCIVSRLSL